MVTRFAFTALVAAVALERLLELAIARRNTAWARARGGVESGRGHFPAMAALHTGLLVGAVTEVWVLDRPFLPALGWTMLALVCTCQAIRYWCITALGRQWNTRVIVVPGLPRVTGVGPYRWLRHPNYVAVVIEGMALPMVHTAWLTATIFTVLNAALLRVRLRVEEAALGAAR
jgi:methyltransferase